MTTNTPTATNGSSSPSFAGFEQADFDVFHIEGLEERMAAIQQLIRPKFQQIGEALATDLAVHAGNEMFLHVAKHARRTVNPPKDTWLAVCANKRGYKAHPHFQLGLFDDHLFLWFALIYEAPNKKTIAQAYLNQIDDVIASIPAGYRISLDHTKKESLSVDQMDEQAWKDALTRFRDVQKAELLVGRHIPVGDPLLKDGKALYEMAASTFEALMPLYRLSLV
ncbi:DUF1054 domain-containing protein [Paenibacillus sp. NPDC058071]|uniref:DUF1054 domain-containing protein n=1 Tax=Paenibacillus sp. NPDC058071 TaxID=3346326 RepID=UPI0036DF6C53